MAKTKHTIGLYNYYCHEGNVYCFNIGKSAIYGGGLYRKANYDSVDIIVALGIDVTRRNLIEFYGFSKEELQQIKQLLSVNKRRKSRKIIYIDWDDGSIPDLNRNFWISLIKYFKQLKDKKILFSCLGGHGRTGTALAILAGLYLKVENPIQYIRKIYCKNAVETLKQVEYVNMICNTNDNSEPSFFTRVEYYDGGIL